MSRISIREGVLAAWVFAAMALPAAQQAFAWPPESNRSSRDGATESETDPDPQAVARIEQLSEAFASVAAAVKPSVVNISSVVSNSRLNRELRKEFPENLFQFAPVTGTGSGVIFDSAGFIVTNNHVVTEADAVRVTLADGRKLNAQVVGTDPMTDLAVIKVSASGLKAAKFGESERVRVGHFVLAIGSPFRLGHSVSHGIISAIGRSDDIDVSIDYKNWIQTDAPINPGNSGGPLINARGEVIGINVAIATENGGHQGVGFAIPSSTVRRIANILKTGERVVRGYLGVVIQQVDEPMAAAYGLKEVSGVFIGDVGEKSPAARGGLKQEDIVLAIDGTPVRSREQLQQIIADTKPGSAVALTVWREGRERKVSVTVKPQPEGFSVSGYLRELNRGGKDEDAEADSGDDDTSSRGEADDENELEADDGRSPSPRDRLSDRRRSRSNRDDRRNRGSANEQNDSSDEDASADSDDADGGKGSVDSVDSNNGSDSDGKNGKDHDATSKWGFEASTLTPELSRKYRLPSSLEDGVLITDVNPASEAWACRLRRGMVIVRANNTTMRLLDDLADLLTPAALARGVRLKIRDRSEEYFLVLRVK